LKNILIRMLRRVSFGVSLIGIILSFLFIILYHEMVFTIPVGHASVLWHRISFLRTQTSEGPLAEGIQVILPWDRLYTYDLRLQHRKESYQVVSKDGLHFQVTLGFRWRAIRKNIVNLNQTIGPDYLKKLLIPEIGSTTREIAAHFSAEDLYTSKRVTVQKAIYDAVTADTLPNGIISQELHNNSEHSDVVVLSDILIAEISLPKQIKAAIENKLEQSQIAQEYEYRLIREHQESNRKRIEAEGIRDFQKIVTPAITESYLRWRGIEATLSLSESENSKVVIIGNNATGLPLILDTRSNDTPHVSPSSPTTSVNAPKAQSQKRASTSDPLLTTRKTQAQDKVNKDQ
jgi:prohibitin 1